MKKIIIFISGRGSNMTRIVEETKAGQLKGVAEVVLVFSNNPDALGLVAAQRMGIPTASIASKGKKRTEFDQQVIQLLTGFSFDLIVLAGFMRRLSPKFTTTYPNKIINIHPADTKLHRGLGAYVWAWDNRLPATKITVHYVNEHIDDGEIILQAHVDLAQANSLEEVEKLGLEVEHQVYAKAIHRVLAE